MPAGSRLGREVLQEAVGSEKAVDLLIVENDPAQAFEPLVLALRRKLAGMLGEIGQAHAGLAELSLAMHEHRRLAHLVDRSRETPALR